MPDLNFSAILQDPTTRELVQDNSLVRQFLDPLYPRNLFRGEAPSISQPGQSGDRFIFTGTGLMQPVTEPIVPGDTPDAQDYTKEQWDMQLHEYVGRAPDTHMPTSALAIVNLLTENLHKLGLHAAQSLNRKVRDNLCNAGMSGWTVASAAVSGASTIPVQRLNGFTTARRPDLPAGEPVQFAAVSSNNPLSITFSHGGTNYTATVVGYTPATAGDQTGPGTLTVLETVTLSARDAIWSMDASYMVRASGGNSIDSVTGANMGFTYDLYRAAVARLEDQNVPKLPDGYYHWHFNSTSKSELFATDEAQRLLTSLPDHYWFTEFALGTILGGLVFVDTETPRASNVVGGLQNTYVSGRKGERFGGEMYNASGDEIQRPICIGAEAVYEYFNDMSGLITAAGVNGEVGEFQPARLTANGVEVNADRVQVFIRAPIDVLNEMVTSIWKCLMDWPCRTDAATGDAARYKRVCVVESL
jgi:hypothetical protein